MMPTLHTYHWEGISTTGQTHSGKCLAKNANEVIQRLSHNNITVLKTHRKLQFKRRKKSLQLENDFTIKLHTLLSQGLNIDRALDIIDKSDKDFFIQTIVRQAKQDLLQGQSLAQSLEKHQIFTNNYITMINCAEETNQLSEALQHLRQHLDNRLTVKKQIKQALRYPLFVIVISVVVIAALMIFVVPQFESTFNANGKSLPFLTKILLDFSRWLHNHGVSCVVILACLIFSLKKAFDHCPPLKQAFERSLHSTPLIRSYYQTIILLNITQTISFCLQSGMTLPKALLQFTASQSSLYVHTIIQAMIKDINAGHRFSDSMQSHRLFTTEICALIAIAEETNTLAQTCSHLSNQLMQTLFEKNIALATQIEPIIMIILSMIIGVVVIAMYLPLFQLGSVM